MEERPYPCCEISRGSLEVLYTVYDSRGSVMISTKNWDLADHYLTIAHLGITARLYLYLEQHNYRIPRSDLEWIKAPLQGY